MANADRVALERRLAEQVEGWRQDCPCTVKGGEVCLACQRATCGAVMLHGNDCVCEGDDWIPGVAEADGTIRRIALQDLLVYADNINDDRLLEFWHQLWNVKFSQPDDLLESAMEALAEALEARNGA